MTAARAPRAGAGAPRGRSDALATAEHLFATLDELWRERRLLFVPIRHHSPACARLLRSRLRELRPESILIEGPRDFGPLVPILLHPRAVAPFAVYSTFVDQRRRATRRDTRSDPPARFAAYYPFCDYSPELVALRTGNELGARLRFIDLTFPEQIVARRKSLRALGAETEPRAASLLAEGHLRHSRYVAELARREGCRDENELWDHLFENRAETLGAAELERQLAGYCLMARLDYDASSLEVDGTQARERAMAGEIRDELERNGGGTTVVVTGGFHTVALPHLVAAGAAVVPRLETEPGEALNVLTRYSFEQLDALNGYSSGMPSPYYYQRCWDCREEGGTHPESRAAADLLVEIGRRSRQRDLPFAVSTADVVAALSQTQRLAHLRGHPAPSRSDLLDGAASCFLKGESGAGSQLRDLIHETLAGERVGRVPRDAGLPPIVQDFRRRCAALRLDLTSSTRRHRALDLYRKRNHRELSRFFHALRFLGVPFASFQSGPDFRRGLDLELMQEHWLVGWSPRVESALVEASVFGATVEEAAAEKLRRAMAALEGTGEARSASSAVELLTVACRMGLHRHAGELLDRIASAIPEDPELVSLADALDELALLWQSREPLEAHRLAEVPRLAQLCFRRSCSLLGELGEPPEELVGDLLFALASLREHVSTDPDRFDRELFVTASRRQLEHARHPAMAGATAGILFAEGSLAEAELVARFRGELGAALRTGAEGGNPSRRTAFLRGLMVTGRESLWQRPRLLAAVDEVLATWSEEEFLRALPELRLAFAALSPRELDRVARLVARLHGGGEDEGARDAAGAPETAEVMANRRVEAAVREALAADGLEAWLAELAPDEARAPDAGDEPGPEAR